MPPIFPLIEKAIVCANIKGLFANLISHQIFMLVPLICYMWPDLKKPSISANLYFMK